jgi:long-chain fatty acid transport protein
MKPVQTRELPLFTVPTGASFLAPLLLVPFWITHADAAGFALREYGFAASSTSFAGASAQADSPGFLAYNPASSSGVTGWDAQFTLNAIYPTSSATYSLATTSLGTPAGGTAKPGDFIQDAYEPGMSLRYRLNEDWTAGLSVSAPWGLGTRYNSHWAGRYYAVESKLVTVNLSPTLAWKVSNELAVSAGLQVQYAHGTLSNAIDFGTLGASLGVPGSLPGEQDGFAEINASDWAGGFVLGALWQPSPGVTLGASWRSALRHSLHGKADFTLDGSGIGAALASATGAFADTRASAALNLPAVGSLGASVSVSPKVKLLLEAGFTRWSDFQELRARFDNPLQPDNVQRYAWRDSLMGAVGIRYEPEPGWVLRAGAACDESPTRDTTRDPRIPDADRTWIAFGIEHDISDHTSLQVGYARLMFPEEPVALGASSPGNELRGNLQGSTDADADMISIQITMR